MNPVLLAKIKDFLKKHPKLDYWQKVFVQSNNWDFTQLVLKSLDDASIQIRPGKEGGLYPDRVALNIACTCLSSGIYAHLEFWLKMLATADAFHMLPVVTVHPDSFLWDREAVEGADNPFEYYFLPPAGIGAAQLEQCANVCDHIMGRIPVIMDHRMPYEPDLERERGSLANAYAKYIHLRPELEEWINGCISSLLHGRRTLGVQVRATDFRREFADHPVFVEPAEYADRAAEIMERDGFSQLYLATDEQSVVELFLRRFGERCLYYDDVYRSGDGRPIHLSRSEWPLHRYRMGREALRDMLTLSVCDGLVCSYARISSCVRIAKAARGETFAPMEILAHGIAEGGEPCMYSAADMRGDGA